MKTKDLLMCVLVLTLVSTIQTASGQSPQLGFGASYLNQTFEGERLGNLLTQDFTLQLDRQDIGAFYRARLHDDAVIWQRLEVGPRLRNVQLFYSLDLRDTLALSGGGVRVSRPQGIGRFLELSAGVYDRGFCFEGKCSVERNGFVGRIGMEYRKIQDTRWWGPSVSVGWRW